MTSVATTIVVTKGLFGFHIVLTVPDDTVYVTLERRANDIILPVENASNLTVTDKLATEITVDDYSALQNTVVEYRAVSLWTDGATSEIVKGAWTRMDADFLNFGGDTLFSASRPDLRLQVTVEQISTVTRNTPQEIVYGLDRADPIVVSGRTRYPEAQLTFYTFDDPSRRQLLSLLRNTDIMALSPWKPNFGWDGVPYFAIGRFTEDRPSPRGYEPTRKWVVDIHQVEPYAPAYGVGSSPTPVPPPDNNGPSTDPNTDPDPEGTILWNVYLDDRWRDIGTMDWGEVAGTNA